MEALTALIGGELHAFLYPLLLLLLITYDQLTQILEMFDGAKTALTVAI